MYDLAHWGLQHLDLGLGMVDHVSWGHSLPWLDFDFPSLLAQAIRDVDILRDFQEAWNKFVSTGQIWALIIGLILGWLLKGFTTF